MREQLHDAHVYEYRRQQQAEPLHDAHVVAWRAWLAKQAAAIEPSAETNLETT